MTTWGHAMEQFDPEQQRRIIEDALEGWLQKKYADVGRWTIRGIVAGLFALGMYLYLMARASR